MSRAPRPRPGRLVGEWLGNPRPGLQRPGGRPPPHQRRAARPSVRAAPTGRFDCELLRTCPSSPHLLESTKHDLEHAIIMRTARSPSVGVVGEQVQRPIWSLKDIPESTELIAEVHFLAA